MLGRMSMPYSLRVIRDEHAALAALLRSARLLVQQAQRAGRTPDFGLLRAMLLYVDEFPERRHHPKETELLFPKLRQRCPELGPVLDRLEREHAGGELAVRELEHALLAWEVMGEPRRQAFVAALDRYLHFYLQHMRIEEDEVLPAAQRLLTSGDWAVLDAAFADNLDPLLGHAVPDDYAPLFSAIVQRAPAPVGLGPVPPD